MSPPNAEPESDPMREMSADLSVTNELLESHCACCLVVLNMKLRRDFHLFKKLLPPTPVSTSIPLSLQMAKKTLMGPLHHANASKAPWTPLKRHCPCFCHLLWVQGITPHFLIKVTCSLTGDELHILNTSLYEITIYPEGFPALKKTI